MRKQVAIGKQDFERIRLKDGVKFEGWINPVTNELDLFYSVMEWRFGY